MRHHAVQQRRSRAPRGAVLFVVVIVIALISLAAYGFAVLMQTENQAARLSADQMQVDSVAESATEYLRVFAALPRSQRDLLGGWQDNSARFQDIVVDFDSGGTRHGRFSIVAEPTGDTTQGIRFGIENRSCKLSLAALLEWDRRLPGSGRAALMRLPGMNETVADCLLDWIDADDMPREFGAEAEFYLASRPPRQPPNEVPSVLEPLFDALTVSALQQTGAGIAAIPEMLTGPRDSPAAGDTAVPARDITRVWRKYLTPTSGERNESYGGAPRINLNQPDLSRLYQELTSTFGDELAKFVVALRLYGPSPTDGKPGGAAGIPKVDLAASPTYELASVLDVVDVAVTIPSDDDESGERFASPLSASGQTLLSFCDQTTADSAAIITGHIDINTAPREVLLAIPNFPPEAIEQLLAVRGPNADMSDRRHVAWLLGEGILQREALIELLPYISTGGEMIEAEVVAYYDADSPWARRRIAIDGTRTTIPTIYYRDLSRTGNGFHLDQLSLQHPGGTGAQTSFQRPSPPN